MRSTFWFAGFVGLLALPRAAAAQIPAAPAEQAPATPAPAVVPAPVESPPASPPAVTTAAAPSPAPAPAAPSTPPRAPALGPGEALVHVAVDYREAWLETRNYVDSGAFVRTCPAPCDLKLNVQGLEARVVAPGMTTSNTFRFDAGTGWAGVKVEGGSATARSVGIVLLAAGIPVALGGMALFAQGKVKDNSGLQIAGIAGLALGGVSVGVSLPLLLKGTTHVKDAKGALIAISTPLRSAF